MPSLLDGAEYWHAGVRSRCREVVHALQRGARRGFLDLGSIMKMVKAHYGAGGGGRWIEEEEENGRLETPAQDGYHSYSAMTSFVRSVQVV